MHRMKPWIRFVETPIEGGGGSTSPDPTPKADASLGETGLKALQTERDARKAAEKALNDATAKWEAEKATLTKKAQEASDTATKAQAEAARVNVFRTKRIPTELEEFVTGATVEELEASAEKVLAAFHPTPPATGGQGDGKQPLGMRPDMTQGAAQPGSGMDVDALISTAESKGDYKAAIELKAQKLGQLAQTTNH